LQRRQVDAELQTGGDPLTRSTIESMSDAGALTLEMKRVLPAGRPVVFAAFTDPDQLAEWWGPVGFTVPSVRLEARVGARYRIQMQPPEGDAFHLTGEFREVEPPAR